MRDEWYHDPTLNRIAESGLHLHAPCLIDRSASKHLPNEPDDNVPPEWDWSKLSAHSWKFSASPLLCPQPILDQFGRRVSMADACELQTSCPMAHFFYVTANHEGYHMHWCGCVIEVSASILFRRIRRTLGEHTLEQLKYQYIIGEESKKPRLTRPTRLRHRLLQRDRLAQQTQVAAFNLDRFSSDIIGCIAACLPASDIFTLRMVSTRLRAVCQQWLQQRRVLSKRIAQRLASLGLAHWTRLLQESGAVLSGSFVLHALNEPPSASSWKPHDIDVYLCGRLNPAEVVVQRQLLPYWRLVAPATESDGESNECFWVGYPFHAMPLGRTEDSAQLMARRSWDEYKMMSNESWHVDVDTVQLPASPTDGRPHVLTIDFIVTESVKPPKAPAPSKPSRPSRHKKPQKSLLKTKHPTDKFELNMTDEDTKEPRVKKRKTVIRSHDSQSSKCSETTTKTKERDDKLSTLINHTFDLDIVKNTYNGKSVHILNLPAFASRSSDALRGHPLLWPNCMRRSFKYKSRGYQIEPFYVNDMRRTLGEPPAFTDLAVKWKLWKNV